MFFRADRVRGERGGATAGGAAQHAVAGCIVEIPFLGVSLLLVNLSSAARRC